MKAAVVVGLVGVVLDVIEYIEEQSNQPGSGPAKQALAIALIERFYNKAFAGTPDAPAFSELVDSIKAIINAAVAVYNALGLFRK